MRVKLYKCDNGRLYKLPEKCCIYCKHCSDILYDYSHGPYMMFCDCKEPAEDANTSGSCNEFIEDMEDPCIIYREE